MGLCCGKCSIDGVTTSAAALNSATFTNLTFTTQKIGVRGKLIFQSASKDPLLCPKAALVCRILHLQTNGAASTSAYTSALGRYSTDGKWSNLTPP